MAATEYVSFSPQICTVVLEHIKGITRFLKSGPGLTYYEFTVLLALHEAGNPVLLDGLCDYVMLKRGTLWHMLLAMALMVMGSQAFAVTVCCAVPNLRLSLSICSLTGILTFSIAAYSFPVPSMYPAVGIFSYILPMRYYFLIYADQALNGIPLYYSRWYYAALLMFPLVAMLPLRRLRKHCLNPVYVP